MKIAMACTAVFGWALTLHAQTRLQGIVLDSTQGSPLSGAQVQSARNGAITDASGSFVLEWDGVSPVTVRYLGFTTYRGVPAGNPVTVYLVRALDALPEVEVSALRADERTPFAFTDMTRADIAARNDGRDLPMILEQTPSVVTTSDAGAGIGYTGIRIRGTDNTRINVTMNGVPLNDPESHGVFWVNTPDLASSTSSIQIQRGAGTSTNGAGAFGASIHLETEQGTTTPYGQVQLGAGSFQTYRANVGFGTGLMNNHWVVEGRLSTIQSGGYIDRATADLQSYFVQAAWLGNRTRVRAVHFRGRQETYQAWNGIPESRYLGDVQGMQDFVVRNGLNAADSANLLQSGNTTYNFFSYPNEVDNYGQDHYQLHWDQQWNPSLRGRLSAHYTKGQGYFEQFRNDDPLANYNLPPVVVGNDTVFSTDLVRRRWLDNDFFGLVGSLVYEDDRQQWILGGAANRYLGDHFGEVIWARYASVASPNYRYYFSQSTKDDANLYLRGTRQWGRGWSVYADVQVRAVRYTTAGTDNDLRNIAADANFLFFNPKAGVQYARGTSVWYLSYAQANREPVRSDFIDAPAGQVPLPEQLHNVEAGWRRQGQVLRTEVNGFAMLYRNQLVLTGELNDVGAAVRTNVEQSQRLGVEVQATWQPTAQWNLMAHASASTNTISNHKEYLYDYLNNTVDTLQFSTTQIALSPALVAGGTATWMPHPSVGIGLEGKYVSRQFLDNTAQVSRSLDAFAVFDAVLRWNPTIQGFPGLEIQGRVNNLFNTVYAPNGYSYSYRFGDVITENFYYPMARTNFLVNVLLRF